MDNKKFDEKFQCIKCTYITSNKYSYNKHLMTAKHKKDNMDNKKVVEKFQCNKCNYNTSNKICYDKHLMTAKHKMDNKSSEVCLKVIEKNKCNCGKIYKHIQGLYKHKKICDNKNLEKKNIELPIANTIIKSNNSNLEPYNIITELLKQNNELQKQIIEISKEPKQIINNYTNTSNNTTTNQSFNLNVFLNETCKDAMDVKEFLDNLNPTIEDLENVGEKGFVRGISDIILNSLKSIDINKRPIHCTDIKREIVYMKEDGAWNKDDKDNSRMKELIRKVENKNFYNVFEWQKDHPDIMILDSPDYMKRNMLIEKSCEAVNKEDKVRGKVLKELLKEIHINGK